MITEITRQIVLDIETTGINKLGVHYEGHRIIEIGAVEIINRRLTGQQFHIYLQPKRPVDQEAFNIHGISDYFLANKPTFAEIVDDFLAFICHSELVIHNAPFDIGFIDYELNMLNHTLSKIESFCTVTDSLQLARKMFPGKRNSLDALCYRYMIDNSKRTLHSALLDAEILANVFLLMTSSQTQIHFINDRKPELHQLKEKKQTQYMQHTQPLLQVIYASKEEMLAHESQLDFIQEKSGNCLWRGASQAIDK